VKRLTHPNGIIYLEPERRNTMFDIGEKVLVFRDHHDNDPRIQTVSKVTPRKVTLADGSAYTADGYKWGDSKSWFRSYIKHADEKTLAEVREHKAYLAAEARKKATIKAIVSFVSHDMTADELDGLAAHLHNMGMPKVGS
jgi:hypothetical protein